MVITGRSIHGGDIYKNKVKYDFSSNINPYGLPENVKKEIVRIAGEVDKYPDPYCLDLRKAISDVKGFRIDNIIASNGAGELIYSFASLYRGKKAIIVGPTFLDYEKACIVNEVNYSYYYLKEENGFLLSKSFLDYLKISEFDLVIINNPNNPTGLLVDQDILIEIAKICKDKNSFLFIDECFMDFVINNSEYSLEKYIDNFDNLFILKAFTKSYAMAGIRLGYGVCNNQDILNHLSESTCVWNVSTIAQKCGAVAIKEKEYLDESIKYIKKERDYLITNLRDLGFVCFNGETNYLFFKAFIGLDKKLLERGILIRSCANYPILDESYYRIAVRTKKENEILINNIREITNG